ncbi:hypothetical protein BDC45DRAFT_539252 [Circinella umbellata]|nr:hypothetical protein BDC45DRAFT_539252 [Circinella umbellata]
MEIVIVESSSGGLSEDMTHSIEDTLKTIKCATVVLISAATKYKNTSIKTFRKLKMYSIHINFKRFDKFLIMTLLNTEFLVDERALHYSIKNLMKEVMVEYFD